MFVHPFGCSRRSRVERSFKRGLGLAFPDYQQLMLPVLRLAAVGDTRVPLAGKKIADKLGVTVEERNELLFSRKRRILQDNVPYFWRYVPEAG